MDGDNTMERNSNNLKIMKIYAKITADEYGMHLTPTGERFMLNWGHKITSPTGQTPEEMGYTAFPSLQDALAAWGLEQAPAEVSSSQGQENDENDLTTTE